MLCSGYVESLNQFLYSIRTRVLSGIGIEQFVKDEIVTGIDLNLLLKFLKLETNEISNISRKPDKGVKLLEALPNINEIVIMLPDIKTYIGAMNLKFDAFTDEKRIKDFQSRNGGV